MAHETSGNTQPNPAQSWAFAQAAERPQTGLDLSETLYRLEPTDAQSLVESLQPGELTPKQLCDKADRLLDKHGERTTVNGVEALVTRKAYQVDQEHGSFYVRIGRPVHTDDGKVILPSFIFATTPDFEDIETPNEKLSELFFDYEPGHGVRLLNGPDAPTPTGYRSNRSGHLKLAAEIIQNLSTQYKQGKQVPGSRQQSEPQRGRPDPQQMANDAWQHAKAKGEERDKRREQRAVIIKRSVVGGLAGLVAAGLIDLAVSDNSSSSTSKGNGKEVIQKALEHPICNPDGVCADGPGTPLDTTPLAPLADISRLPVNAAYEKTMAKISYPGTETLNPEHIEETQQGTYRYLYPSETTNLPNDGQCTFIEGNFHQGISSIFTTSSKIATLLRVKVLDTSTLEVCKVPGAPANTAGSFYIVRGNS